MNTKVLYIAGRRCRLFSQDAPQCLLVQPLGVHQVLRHITHVIDFK